MPSAAQYLPLPPDSYNRKVQEWAARREDIFRHREAGWTITDIAKKFGVSRARIHQIISADVDAA